MYVDNNTIKQFQSYLLNNLKNDKENYKTFISPQETVNKRKSENKLSEFKKINAVKRTKNSISIKIQDIHKNNKKISYSCNNLKLKSQDNLANNIGNSSFRKLHNSQSIQEFSFPLINLDIRESNAREKYRLSREIQELLQFSNPNNQILEEENKKFPFELKDFSSLIDPIKNSVDDLKKIIGRLEKDAKERINLDKICLQGKLENFLEHAENNYNNHLGKKVKEILDLLNSIREYNLDKFETYDIVNRKIQEYSLKNMELSLKINELNKVKENLENQYNEKILYRKNLIEFLNEKKKKLKIAHEKIKNNPKIKIINDTRQVEQNLSNFYNSEKLANVKSSLIKSFEELEIRNKKLKNNLNHNSQKNKNEILPRIFEIIKEYKQNDKKVKEEFRFSTTLKSFHQESKDKFFTAKTRYGLGKTIQFTKETPQSSVNIKSLIEFIIKDEFISKLYNQHIDKMQDIDQILK